MAVHWTCPKGHQTDSPPVGDTPACPLCGALLTQIIDSRPVGNLNPTIEQVFDRSSLKPSMQPTIDPSPTPRSMSSLLGGSRPDIDPARAGSIEIPGYEVLSELGRGGMGVVYKARQKGLNRLVAIKMILAAEHAGPDQRARFHAEAEAVAQIQHPHIVQVYEVGEIEGRAFFSLEYVDGGSLAQKLQGQPQAPRPAAALMSTLARAVAVAHEKNIVHRDLKPANILLANPLTQSESFKSINAVSLSAQHPFGVPKVTDFGLAKRLEGGTGQTQSGSIMGTPSYMAPEQASGRVKEIGPPTDVYALGAILYELLTGRPPFLAESPLETIMLVIRDEPVPPRQLNAKVPRDLEIICLKCLEKPVGKRYSTATELADDLDRFLEGDPISARPATKIERARKWVRRHPMATGLLGVGVLALTALITGGLIYHEKLQTALKQAQEETEKLNNERALTKQRTIRLTVSNGTNYLNSGDLLRSLPWFANALTQEGGDRHKEEMHRIRLHAVLRQCPKLLQAWFHDGRVNDAAMSPDGKTVATACEDGSARLFTVGDPGIEPIQELKHPGGVVMVRFASDGKRLATACSDGRARIFDCTTGKLVGEPMTHAGDITALDFYPIDGLRLLTASRDGTARIWDVLTGEGSPIIFKHSGPVLHAEFNFDGSAVATSSADGTARVWDPDTGKPITPAFRHAGPVVRIRFSPDGKRVLTASQDQTAGVWAADATGRPLTQKPIRRSTPLIDCAFSPNGRDVITASSDGTGRVWDTLIDDWRTWVVRHDSPIASVVFSPDGRSFATASDDNTARVWDLSRGEPLTPHLRHSGSVYRAIFNADGDLLLTASQDGMVRLWDIAAGRAQSDAARTTAAATNRTTYSPDRRLLLRVMSANKACVFDAGTGEHRSEMMQHAGPILHTAFSPDGKYVLTTSTDRTARVWEAATGHPAGEPLRHGSDVLHASFSPDGRLVATASSDNTARVWNIDGTALTPPLRHNGNVERVVFSPDGRCLLTTGEDGYARMWDSVTGESLAPPQKPGGWVAEVLASTGGGIGWDLAPDQRDAKLLVPLSAWLAASRIDPDGNLVPLDVEAMREIWKELRTPYAAEFERPDNAAVMWHDREAASAEAARDWFAAAMHLTKLMLPELPAFTEKAPKNPRLALLAARRGRAYAEMGKWAEAANDFAAAQACGSEDDGVLTGLPLALLAAENTSSFAKACDAMLENAAEQANTDVALRAAWVCLLGAPAETNERLKQLAERAGSRTSEESPCLVVHGAAQARQGNWEQAAALLGKGHVLAEPMDAVRAWLYLALTEHNLSRPEEAKRWLAQAGRWLDKNSPTDPRILATRPTTLTWQQRIELQLLRAQVQKALTEPVPTTRIEKIAD